MEKGSIDPKVYQRRDTLVIDVDLIASVKFSWKSFNFNVKYNPVTNGIMNFLERKSKNFDNVVIAGVGIKCGLIFKALSEKLFLNNSMQKFDSEEDYREWLLVIHPVLHFATKERSNYCVMSAFIDIKAIGEYLD
jgi:hypothetical protein